MGKKDDLSNIAANIGELTTNTAAAVVKLIIASNIKYFNKSQNSRATRAVDEDVDHRRNRAQQEGTIAVHSPTFFPVVFR